MSEPTDKELHALIEVIESDYDRSSGPGEAWSVEGLAQRILDAGFRAGAASQPTAADELIQGLIDKAMEESNALGHRGDYAAQVERVRMAFWLKAQLTTEPQANLNPPAPVQVVPETPKLDPYPWKSQIGAHRTREEMIIPVKFKPDPEFSQDRTAYGLPTESEEQR